MTFCAGLTMAVTLLAVTGPMLELFVAKEFPVLHSGGILITGASSGIGLDAAIALSAKGYRVYCGVRKEKDAESIRKSHPRLRPIFLEVTDEEQIRAAEARIREELASEKLPFVGLVNNAGISRRLPVEVEDFEAVKWLFEVNFFGAYRVSQVFTPLVRESSGRIVHIGSVAGIFPHPGSSAYSATKAALKSLADVQRLELSKFNVSVSIVEPAYVKTNIHSKVTGENAVWKNADPAKLALYQKWVDHYEKARGKSEEKADTTEVTNKAIVHALTNANPDTRYVVANINGMPASILKLASEMLPERLLDMIKLKIMPI